MFLAIDLGSGGPKVALVADNSEIVAVASEKTTIHLLPNGGAEQDPEEWWRCIKKASKNVIKKSGVSPKDIIAVCCDSQWSVVVPISEQGESLMNAIHWLDIRGGQYNRAMIQGFPNVKGYGLLKLLKWIKLTGIAPTRSGIDSLGHILFIKNARPEIYKKTHKFLEPMDYITFRLTGKITASQETMLPFLLVDNRQWSRLDYSDELLKLAGLEKDKFPELIPNDGFIGNIMPSVAKELGLSPSAQVLGGINDTNSSAIGSGAIRNFDGIIYIGTSMLLTCHLPFKKTNIFRMLATIPSPIESKYLLLAELGIGGKNLDFYLEKIVYADDEFNTGAMPDDAYDRLNRIAADIPAGSDSLLFLPWLNGSIVPEENVSCRAGFFNLSLRSTRSHMTRAIMEGIAYNNRWVIGPAEKFIGKKFMNLRFAGGGAQSDLWAQIHADVLGVPIHQVVDPAHTTLRGTAFLAFNKLGYRSLEELQDIIKINRVFEPDDSNRAVYDKMYKQFRSLYKRNKKIFSELNKE